MRSSVVSDKTSGGLSVHVRVTGEELTITVRPAGDDPTADERVRAMGADRLEAVARAAAREALLVHPDAESWRAAQRQASAAGARLDAARNEMARLEARRSAIEAGPA